MSANGGSFAALALACGAGSVKGRAEGGAALRCGGPANAPDVEGTADGVGRTCTTTGALEMAGMKPLAPSLICTYSAKALRCATRSLRRAWS